MPPKKSNKNNNSKPAKSKEEQRLEQYLNHPANQADHTQDQKQQPQNTNKKGGKNAKGAAEPPQKDTENEIAQLLKDVDLSKPLPDFTQFENSINVLQSTLKEMDTLIENISTNNSAALGQPPAQEEESSFKNAQLTPDIIQKRDQIIKGVKKTIELYEDKRKRVDQLLNQENMKDLKDQLTVISENLVQDQKYKEQILSLF